MDSEESHNTSNGIENLKELILEVTDSGFQLGTSDPKELLSIIVNHGIRSNLTPPSFERTTWVSKCLTAVNVVLEKDVMVLIHLGPFDDLGTSVDEDTTLESTISSSDEGYLYKWLIRSLIPLLTTSHQDLLLHVKSVFITIIMSISMNSRLFRCKLEIKRYLLTVFDVYSSNMMKSNHERKDTINMMTICTNLFYLLTDFELRKRLMLDSSYDHIFESAIRKSDYLMVNLHSKLNSIQQNKLAGIKTNMLSYSLNYSINDETNTISRLKFLVEVLRDTLVNASSISIDERTQITLAHAILKTFQRCVELNHVSLFVNGLEFNSSKDIVLKGRFHNLLSKVILFIDYFLLEKRIDTSSEFADSEFDSMVHSLILETTPLTNSNIYKALLYVSDQYKSIDITTYKQYIVTLQSKLSSFKTLDRFEKYSIITSIGDLYCIISNSMNIDVRTCEICSKGCKDFNHINPKRSDLVELSLINSFIEYFVLNQNEEEQDVMLEISKLLTISKIFSHYQPMKNFEKCPVFKFVYKSLFSTNRDIRLLSVRILPLYIRSNENIKDNKQDVFTSKIVEILGSKDLNEPSNFIHIEFTIMAWSLLATASSGEILRPILFKMVDFLASSNKVQSTFAFHELQIIASSKKKTPWQLMSLIIDSWSKLIAQQLHNRPLLGQKISSLVGLPVDIILSQAATHIVPKTVMFYQNDVIGRIAEIQGCRKYDLIMGNIEKIVAELVTSVKNVNEAVILSVLKNSSPQIAATSLNEFVSPTTTIWEILMLYSPRNNEELIIKSIYFILEVTGNPSLVGAKTRNEAITKFFQSSILALIQNFSDIMKNTKGFQSYSEKRSSLNAVEFIVKLSPLSIVSALPQICTCLQTIIDTEMLTEKTLTTWKILVEYLPEKHLITIVDQTVAFIIQKWSSLDFKCQAISTDIINLLFDKSENFRIRNIYTFYSIADNDDLVMIYQKVDSVIKSSNKPLLLLKNIERRCQNDNKIVVKQALVDLKRFLKNHGDLLYKTLLKQAKFPIELSKLFSALLDILHKFKSHDEICLQCCKILGTIGAIDPLKLETPSKQNELIIVSDFEESTEKIRFVSRFLNDKLVPSFWASEDPKRQTFLAFAMQEYLSILGLNGDVESFSKNTVEWRIWGQFSDITRSTLTPLTSSKFISKPGSYRPLSYPIFNSAKGHSKWIREWAFDTLKRTENVPGSKIFEICASLAKEEASVAAFILPYAALSVLINNQESSEQFGNFQKEIVTILSTDINTIHHSATENFKMSLESVFEILDYFRKWIYARTAQSKVKGATTKEFIAKTKKIENLLARIPKDLMAKRSLESDSHERAIFYMEQCVKDKNNDSSLGYIESLQQTYANIGDYDALNGTLKKFSQKSLDGRITQMEYNDNWKMAQDCFEALSEFTSPEVVDPETRLLKSLFDHNLYDRSLSKLNLLINHGIHSTGKIIKKEWIDIGLESAVLSGKLDSVDEWSMKLELNDSLTNGSNLLNYHIGKILLQYQKSDLENMGQSFENVFLLVAGSLSLNRSRSFAKNNSSLVVLHAISDLEDILKKDYDNFESFKGVMNTRLDYTTNEFKPIWNILSLRKTANELVKGKPNAIDTKEIWLKLSKLARKNNRTDLAASSIMRVVGSGVGELEYAKLLWTQGDHSNAISEIKQLLADIKNKNNAESLPAREKAKIQLKYANWLEFTNNSSSSRIIEEYKAVTILDRTWEKGHFEIAIYYNKLLDMRSTNQNPTMNDYNGMLELRTISFFLRSIHHCTNYLFEALPKIIIIWLDYADGVSNIDQIKAKLPNVSFGKGTMESLMKQRLDYHGMILREIIKFNAIYPTYYWYTVLSELLSRIVNRDRESVSLIVDLCAAVLHKHSSQALWSILAQSNSEHHERRKLANLIIKKFESGGEKNLKLLKSSARLFEQLLNLSKFQLPSNAREAKKFTSLSRHFNFDKDSAPCDLVIPLKSNFDITLPSNPHAPSNHNPFPATSRVTFSKVDDRVEVLSSLQAPRHLYIIGSDGYQYGILCKKDDLRKDAKIMEITTFMGYHLDKDKEASKRRLKILTYSVIPMNEECGIIEWVNKSVTLRSTIMPRYAAMGIKIDNHKLVSDFDHRANTKEELKENFQGYLSKFPPVLYQWFIDNFPDPSSWYDARNNFTRSVAVMSMVGYILGLGDRHSENILLIETDGSVMHVDFDCIFEKGLQLGIPETVPFRLTQNIVDAFGITGVEGKFRKSCEVALGLLRKNQHSVISSLQNFFNDRTLHEKGSTRKKGLPDPMVAIKRKLRGILEKEGTAVSVEGQVDFLIQLSTSDEHLSQMYHGWLAFI